MWHEEPATASEMDDDDAERLADGVAVARTNWATAGMAAFAWPPDRRVELARTAAAAVVVVASCSRVDAEWDDVAFDGLAVGMRSCVADGARDAAAGGSC